MSLSLGEKLRQAREERGISLSEVAEQTRISPIYLESIDNDDYRKLPGGIFNRGFIKSYAKYVGLNEQEALLDYSQLQDQLETTPEPEFRSYKPEVLTDDRASSSMMPTIILAAVILAAMTGGILFLVNYLRKPAEPASNRPPAANIAESAPANTTESLPPSVPSMDTSKVEFTAISAPVSLTATKDGQVSVNTVTPESPMTFEPKESLKLSYSKSLAQNVQLKINGKTIALPATPLNPKRATIEFEINKDNLSQIWTSGAISTDVPAANTPAANETSTLSEPSPRPVTKTTPEESASPTPAKAAATPKPKPSASITKPSANVARPAANRPQ